MLDEGRINQLKTLLDTYSREEQVWVAGYINGLVSQHKSDISIQGVTPSANRKTTLVFGTESGNSKKLALQFVAFAKKQGFIVKMQDLAVYKPEDISKEENLLVIISTHGDGEPPVGARKFYDYIHNNQLNLSHIKFSVLALGDSSYPFYCKTGDDVENRLKQLGAVSFLPIKKCDVDFEDDANKWFEDVLKILQHSNTSAVSMQPQQVLTEVKPKGKKFYTGKIRHSINLNDTGSARRTYHIEIETEEPVEYQPGDTLGIVPPNREEVVDEMLRLTGADGSLKLEIPKATGSLRELLINKLGICYLHTNILKKYATIAGLNDVPHKMDLIDLLKKYPLASAAQFVEVVRLLLPIAPRLYTISSSPAAHGQYEIHLTVVQDKFFIDQEKRYGLCSRFLGEQLTGTPVTFYIHTEKNFKLPHSDKDIIMIGPGTGIAPFRSFLAEREATGANGKNWLFFGGQRFTKDFLYQTEIQYYVETGGLSKVDVAFSRDQPDRLYVQHKLKEKASQVFEWISNGACIYVSGVKQPMYEEVDAMLHRIIMEQGNKNEEEAKEYLSTLVDEKRYQKDVY